MTNTNVITRTGNAAALSASQHDQNCEGFVSATETQTGTTYTVLYTDQNKLVELNNASMVCTLSTIATIAAAIDTTSWRVTLRNINAADATINRGGTDTIEGATSLTLRQYESVTLQTNAAGSGWAIVGTYNSLAGARIPDTSADHFYVVGVNELTGDRTITLPLLTGNDTFVFEDHTQTLANKTLTAPTLTSAVLNTAVSGTAVLDEDDMASDSNTQVATQQSIKAYIDSLTFGVGQTWQDLSGIRAISTSTSSPASVYQNTTGKPIMVSVWDVTNESNFYAYCDTNATPTTQVARMLHNSSNANQDGSISCVTFVVPDQSYYFVAGPNTAETGWAELR